VYYQLYWYIREEIGQGVKNGWDSKCDGIVIAIKMIQFLGIYGGFNPTKEKTART